jgi:hypothetical protein
MTTPSSTAVDRDLYVHEISMLTIATGVTTIFTARACQEASLVLLAIAALVSAGFVVKSMLYMGVTTWHPAGKKRRHDIPPRPLILCQETCTTLVGVVCGLYLAPLVQSLFQIDRYDYPEPWMAMTFVAFLLVIKGALYSDELRSFWRSHRRRSRFLQIAATLFIGCLLGLFLYHSRWAFKPAEWWPERYQDVYERPTALISPLFGSFSIKEEYCVRPWASLWQDEKSRLYLEIGIALLILCLLLKFHLYRKIYPHSSNIIAAATLRPAPSRAAPVKQSTSGTTKRMPVPSPGGSKRVSTASSGRVNKTTLAKTQEHRIPTRSGSSSLARTQEHKISREPIGKTRATRMPVAAPRERLTKWEAIHLFSGLGGGLLILPALSNAYWYKRAVYPYGLFWFTVVVCLGVLSVLHLTQLLPEKKKR